MDKGSLRHDQRGIIAIFSVMIIMSILTLLAVGFSTVVRQGQERALDDQLSTQAFYAAESGVNQALQLSRGGFAGTKTDCGGGLYDYSIDPVLDVALTCILVDDQLPEIKVDFVPVVGEGEPFVTEVYPASFADVEVFEIAWDAPIGIEGIPTTGLSGNNPQLLTDRDWAGNIGILRIDLVHNSSANRGTLVSQAHSFFLYPTTQAVSATPATVPSGPNEQGQTILGHCDATPDPDDDMRCRAFVRVPGASSGDNLMRVSSFYNPVRMSLSGETIAGEVVEFKSGQILIDSTGRASDVFRRIQVRVPADPDASWRIGSHPAFNFLSEDSICKRIIGLPYESRSDMPSIPACTLPS